MMKFYAIPTKWDSRLFTAWQQAPKESTKKKAKYISLSYEKSFNKKTESERQEN